MQMHNYKDIEKDILRILMEFPFIKITKYFDERNQCNVAIISLGYEMYNPEDGSTFQTFREYEKFCVEFELSNIEKYLNKAKNYIGYSYDGTIICTFLNGNELLVKRRYTIPHKMKPEKISDANLENYLRTHKRTVLNLHRFKHLSGNYDNPIILGRKEIATAEVVLSCEPSYQVIPFEGEILEEKFRTTKFEIDNIDRSVFDIYKIKRNLYSVVYEIINRTYDYK